MGLERLLARPLCPAERLLEFFRLTQKNSRLISSLDNPEPGPGLREGSALERHARFVDPNLRRNFGATSIHGVFGMTGFRLIYAPTIIPAYIHLLTGNSAAVGLGTALLQLGSTISPIASGARVESHKRIMPYAIRVGSMMRVMILGLALSRSGSFPARSGSRSRC